MPRVQLPDGCYGLDMADGRKYTARPGDTVTVSDNHARAIKNSFYGRAGIMHGGEQFSLGTKTGRWCPSCARMWNAWSHTCPRCGADTVPDTAPDTAPDTVPDTVPDILPEPSQED